MSEELRKELATDAPRLVLRIPGAAIELVRIPAGEFTMGSPANEPDHAANEAPMHRVRISHPFYLGRFEVTQAQYRAVMGELPPQPEGDTVAVSQITYEQAVAFCRRLSKLTGVLVTLPTEAQWEYACRAGTQTAYSAGSSAADLDGVAWYDANSGGRAHPVGEKPPNAWGLHDMHGNVWEYCADFFADPNDIEGVDPVGERSDWRGAMRGGGWMHGPTDCRSARRLVSDDMFGGAGLRIRVDTLRPEVRQNGVE